LLITDKSHHPPYIVNSRPLVQLALLIAMGLSLFLFESLIPRPLPWIKPGLANIATLLALYLINFRGALAVAVMRIVLGSLLLGTLFNPAFVLAFGGGLMATVAMGLTKRYLDQFFSLFGISIIGAFFHNVTQISLASFVVVRKVEILYLLPVMLLSSLPTGFLVGFFSFLLLENTGQLLKS
ncbi:MAG: Gx transporter family protein, partial [candidate division KSB1 bacterium]|nr:Gx transporter family protein [candidate division KSB1 bacterium]